MAHKIILLILTVTTLVGCEFVRTKDNRLGMCLMNAQKNKGKLKPKAKYSKYELDVRKKFNIKG